MVQFWIAKIGHFFEREKLRQHFFLFFICILLFADIARSTLQYNLFETFSMDIS